ncbi:MAG: tetratricopeptide repeat protein [Nitrospinales bacterium]
MNREPVSIQDALNLAVQSHQSGDLEEAEYIYREILKTVPDQPDALHLLGVLAYQGGDHKNAAALINRAIQLRPEFPEAYNNLGNTLGAQDRLGQAADAYRQAVTLNPDFTEAHDNLGKALALQGRLDEAIACYRHAIAIRPDYAQAHNNLGHALGELDRQEEAVAAHRRAIEIDPGYAEAHYNLGIALTEQGKQGEAIACYDRAIAIRPDYAEAHGNLATLYRNQGKLEQAAACCRRVMEIDPANAAAAHMLAALTGQTPESAPPQYIKELFDGFAGKFDRELTQMLDYKTPALLRREFDKLTDKHTPPRRVMDLGCGTGLSGTAFRPIAETLHGIDLSPKMIDKAREKSIYDDLRVDNFVEWLNRADETYDLFTAADVFVYLGNLRPVFQAVEKASSDGAYFAFSTEHADDGDYVLRPTGRYAHSQNHIRSLAGEFGFTVETCTPAEIRKEQGKGVAGDIYILKRLPRAQTS